MNPNHWKLPVIALVVLLAGMFACQRTQGLETTQETPDDRTTEFPTSAPEKNQKITPGTTIEGQPDAQSQSGLVELAVPPDWVTITDNFNGLEGMVFFNQPIERLQAFDDPNLAVPPDFAAGFLVVSPLPEGGDRGAFSEWLSSGVDTLGDQELEGLLAVAHQVGVLNVAVIDHARLERAWQDELAGWPAVVLEGTIHFNDDTPPVLRTQYWLAWSEHYFGVYAQFAPDAAWQVVFPVFDDMRASARFP